MDPQLESLHIANRPKSRYIQTFCFKIKFYGHVNMFVWLLLLEVTHPCND